MTTYAAYSNLDNGTQPEPMRQRLKANVTDFYGRCKRLPGLVVVHPSELAEAEESAKALDLSAEVRASGGCLVPGVWLAEREKADA